MPKYIFVTGGVVSGLGKGITNASVGLLLRSSGLKVDVVKLDPYLNIDPGTMSPYEHGEVYVLADGSETDLDLGHYERFLDTELTSTASVTSGKIYSRILDQEREGKFLGKNVQLIPHVTRYIKHCFVRNSGVDVRLIEIGGSTGDYEGDIFLESLREFKLEFGKDSFHIHLGYIPFLECSGEYKTKPLQVSLRELSRSGLQPDVIVARYAKRVDVELSSENLRKLAMFSNLPPENILALPDLDSIYKVPTYIKNLKIVDLLSKFLGYSLQPKLPTFYQKIEKNKFNKSIKIGVVAKYTKLIDAYLSIFESLKIAGIENSINVDVVLIDSEKLDAQVKNAEWRKLYEVKAVIVPGGFGVRGMNGKIQAIKYCRENRIPYLGICLGLQMAVVEFARNVCKLDAVSSEMFESRVDLVGKDVIIDLMPEQFKTELKGGTMRLGVYDCNIQQGTLARDLFGCDVVQERHRHRLEVQNEYLPLLISKGMIVSGKHFKSKDRDEHLVEMIELNQEDHPYFIATQSHPEFLGRPGTPHPLFDGLIKACLNQKV
ncbi:MAG: CTP synthase [Patescibacteria group bacterium]